MTEMIDAYQKCNEGTLDDALAYYQQQILQAGQTQEENVGEQVRGYAETGLTCIERRSGETLNAFRAGTNTGAYTGTLLEDVQSYIGTGLEKERAADAYENAFDHINELNKSYAEGRTLDATGLFTDYLAGNIYRTSACQDQSAQQIIDSDDDLAAHQTLELHELTSALMELLGIETVDEAEKIAKDYIAEHGPVNVSRMSQQLLNLRLSGDDNCLLLAEKERKIRQTMDALFIRPTYQITEKGRPVSSEHNIFVKGGGCRCWLIELIKKMVIHVRENRIQRLQDKLEKIGDSDPTDEAMNKKAVYEKRIRRITEHMVSATE